MYVSLDLHCSLRRVHTIEPGLFIFLAGKIDHLLWLWPFQL